MSSNALVVGPRDTATATSGMGLIDDVVSLSTAVRDGNWVDAALAGVGTAMDALGTAIDPLGTLIAWGVGWLLDHVDPLKTWLNQLTGNAGAVIGFAQTWNNVATALDAEAEFLAHRIASDLSGMFGEAITAYTARANQAAATLNAIAHASTGISGGLQLVATLVQVVHDLVRDTISQVIGSCTSAIAWAATGIGIPYAISVVSEKAAALSAKIGSKVSGLVRSIGKLDTALTSLSKHLHELESLLKDLLPTPPGRVRLSDGGSYDPRFPTDKLAIQDAAHLSVNDSLHDPDLFARYGIDPPWTSSDLNAKINLPTSDLTPDERALLAEIRDRIGLPDADTVMQKVITPDQVDAYLGGGGIPPDQIRGFVTSAPDTAHLGTPRELYDNLALDYSGSPFTPDADDITIVRYQSTNATYEIPRNADFGGARTEPAPFTGNGFTASTDSAIPELAVVRNDLDPAVMGAAEMWQLDSNGIQRLVAVLQGGVWIPVSGR